MKRITRLDAGPDDLERIEAAKQEAFVENQRLAAIAQAKWEKENTPAKIAEREAAYKKKREEWCKREDMNGKDEFIHNPTSQFAYYEKAKVSNPANCGGCGDHERYRGMIVEIQSQDGCKCMHEFKGPDNYCLWGKIDGEDELHHFESKELEKIETKKVCIQCISQRGPLPAYDGLCECVELNIGKL